MGRWKSRGIREPEDLPGVNDSLCLRGRRYNGTACRVKKQGATLMVFKDCEGFLLWRG